MMSVSHALWFYLVSEKTCQRISPRTWYSWFVTVNKRMSNYKECLLDARIPLIWPQIYIPNDVLLCWKLLELYHDDPLAGHFGIEWTKELLQSKFLWPGLIRGVREHVHDFQVFQATATNGTILMKNRIHFHCQMVQCKNSQWTSVLDCLQIVTVMVTKVM